MKKTGALVLASVLGITVGVGLAKLFELIDDSVCWMDDDEDWYDMSEEEQGELS